MSIRCFNLSAIFLLCVSSLTSCLNTDQSETFSNASTAQLQGKLVVTGSSTIAPLALEIAKRFEVAHPQVRVDVQTGGSSRGISDARSGLADIGMVSRALMAQESDLENYAIARDGVAIITHAKNPVQALNQDQVRAIYTGQTTRWSDVGGNATPITVVNKAEGRSTLEVFLEHFALSNTQIKPHVIIGDNEQGIKTVAGNPDAIAYVSIGAAEANIAQGVAIKMITLEGVAPSTANVANGTYPIARILNLVTKQQTGPLSTAFLSFAQSEDVIDLIAQQNFVALTP